MDFDYIITGSKRSTLSYIHRKAILWPIFDKPILHELDTRKAVVSLFDAWRARLDVLRDAGFDSLQSPGALQFARNCPPEMVYYTAKAVKYRSCGFKAICPWCFARYIRNLYSVVAANLPTRGKLFNSSIKLLEVSNDTIVGPAQVDYLSPILNEFKAWPSKLLSKLPSLGAHYNVQLDPVLSPADLGWRLSYRILAIMPTNWERPELLAENGRKAQVSDINSRKQLINAMSRTCPYPIGLLQGDPRAAVAALHARRDKRCSALTGCFRKRNINNTRIDDE